MPPTADVFSEILNWSKDRPGWQRDALRRLFSEGELSAKEVEELLQLCKSAHGLAEPTSPRVLMKEHLATKGDGVDTTCLITLTHHRGVNALAAEQTITFGSHLTIIYGQNAAGKSGYARILKQACRSRSTEQILGNLLSGSVPVKLQATITFRQGLQGQGVKWTTGSPSSDALAAVSVFDSASAPVYLRDKTDVAFRPFGLDIFDRLVSLCSEVRGKLESEKAKLNSQVPNLPKLPAGTKSQRLVENLTSLTNPAVAQNLATLLENEQARLEELRAHQRDLLAADPKKRAQDLTSKAERIDFLSRHVSTLFSLFRRSSLTELGSSAEALRVAQASLELVRSAALTTELLLGTGEQTWQEMWRATAEFSKVAYPEAEFPFLGSGARCPFCQQEISGETERRLRNFAEYVASSAQAQAQEAEKTYSTALSKVRRAVVRPSEIDLIVNELRLDNPPLAQEVEIFFDSTIRTLEGIEGALSEGVGFLAGLTKTPEAELQSLASRLRERADQLLGEKPVMSPEAITELRELEARATLASGLQVVLDEIERKKRLAAYDQCIGDTTTNAITKKSTELTSRLVTDQLRAGFQEELGSLDFRHLAVEIQMAGGAKGTLFHKLVFSNAPGVAVTNVLSEGESRTLSLAAFLTELKTASSQSTIIFDDPVSSLDEEWRGRIARRLVTEAKNRQVIVFTHDLLFLRFLMDEARRQEVPCAHQYVRREYEAGICSPDLPWVAMSKTDRIGVLRNRWQAAEKTFRTDRTNYEAIARDIFGQLREAWEHATMEVLLNDVVERYRHSIETQKVRVLHDITPDDYKALEEGMAECSRWMRGHDRPSADGTPFPDPETLKLQIETLATWVQSIRTRRKRK